MMFTLNGEILLDDSGSELAFKDFDTGDGECSGCWHSEALCSDASYPPFWFEGERR